MRTAIVSVMLLATVAMTNAAALPDEGNSNADSVRRRSQGQSGSSATATPSQLHTSGYSSAHHSNATFRSQSQGSSSAHATGTAPSGEASNSKASEPKTSKQEHPARRVGRYIPGPGSHEPSYQPSNESSIASRASDEQNSSANSHNSRRWKLPWKKPAHHHTGKDHTGNNTPQSKACDTKGGGHHTRRWLPAWLRGKPKGCDTSKSSSTESGHTGHEGHGQGSGHAHIPQHNVGDGHGSSSTGVVSSHHAGPTEHVGSSNTEHHAQHSGEGHHHDTASEPHSQGGEHSAHGGGHSEPLNGTQPNPVERRIVNPPSTLITVSNTKRSPAQKSAPHGEFEGAVHNVTHTSRNRAGPTETSDSHRRAPYPVPRNGTETLSKRVDATGAPKLKRAG